MKLARRIAGQLGSTIIVFFGVTFFIYAAVFALPGDPISQLAGDHQLSASVIATLRHKYDLDLPLWQQYLHYLNGLVHLQFGTNFTDQPVGQLMASRWPVTITLALTAWLFELVLGIGLGALAALRNNTWIDRSVLFGTVLVSAIPVFVLGVVAQLVLGVKLKWFPITGTTSGWPTSYVVPALVIAVFGLAAVSRLTRESMIESLASDYVRAASARGIGRGRIVGVHVFRNSMIPTVTYLATDLGYLLGGSVVVEGIFNLPGVGNLLFTAVRSHEGPTVVGISTALILIFLVTNVIVDIVHNLLDPRISHA
ncbi:MAG: transporter permease [Frondihabitans sp.]|nr:transporter permease [Frondihabitans sp.]